jgi:hypothetical protein
MPSSGFRRGGWVQRKVFIDVGGHVGETLSVAMQPKWAFDKIWVFEPTRECADALLAMADDRVDVLRAGLWNENAEMDVHDPCTLHASVDPNASRVGHVESCVFLDAGEWMRANVSDADVVWVKVNAEASEVEILHRLIDTRQIGKIDHLVVHFDVEKVGRGHEAAALREALDHAGVDWRDAREVMFGRTVAEKTECWLGRTHGDEWRFRRHWAEHEARAFFWRSRKQLRRRLGAK